MNRILIGVVLWSSIVGVAHSQSTERVSVDSAGVQANSISFQGCSISADGRFVAFASYASNLVPGDTNTCFDIFVHDRSTGQTTRVSVDSTGAQADGPSNYPTISADGRLISFSSVATNLVPGDTNGFNDVFVHDRQTGQTIRVSVDSSGAQGNGNSYAYFTPSLSADGRYVGFTSDASNLVAGDSNGLRDAFVHDMQTGQTIRVSVDSSGGQSNGLSDGGLMSPDGRFVGFDSYASNLVPGDTNDQPDAFIRDTWTNLTIRVSVDSSGIEGNAISGPPVVSADGRYAAFMSYSTNLVANDTNGVPDVFVRDLLLNTTERVSVDSAGGQMADQSTVGSMSADGRYVGFAILNGEIFVHDRLNGLSSLVSCDTVGTTGNGTSLDASISADGRYVAFESFSSNIVTGDTNGTADTFVRDRLGADPVVALCSGDGSGTSCPCGNSGSAWHGCENSLTTGGGLLLASGSASVSADSFELEGSHMPSSASVLYFQGTGLVNGGIGVVFGDGLRCVGGSVVRLGTRVNSNGMSGYGAPLGDIPISVHGSIPAGGGTFFYQAWYRNTASFCTPAGFNLTNAVAVTWQP